MTTHIERDYLDEIIDERRESDPEFARIMQARELAAELAARRKELGLTQQQVAERMGVHAPASPRSNAALMGLPLPAFWITQGFSMPLSSW